MELDSLLARNTCQIVAEVTFPEAGNNITGRFVLAIQGKDRDQDTWKA